MVGQLRGGKVALIGTGMVGSSFAYALVQRGLAAELVLVDKDAERAAGEAMDLNHGLPFVNPMRIRAGGFDAIKGADVVVVTGGKNQHPGETRLDLLQKNAEVIADIVPKAVAAAPNSVIVVATNPVDALTQLASEHAGLPPGRVFGSGTVLDTARFRFLIGDHFGVSPRSVHAAIIGEHGDSQVPVWSLATVGGVAVDAFEGPDGARLEPAARDRIDEQTRSAAYEIIKRKYATYYAIGLGLLGIVEAILRDQKTVLTVSTPLAGRYGAPEGIAASLPTIVGHSGAERVLELALSDAEADAFRRSATILKDHLDQARPS